MRLSDVLNGRVYFDSVHMCISPIVSYVPFVITFSNNNAVIHYQAGVTPLVIPKERIIDVFGDKECKIVRYEGMVS